MEKYEIKLIVAQRKCSYDGEFAPEVLEACDEFCFDDNPEWLLGKLEEHRKDNMLERVEIVTVQVPFEKIVEAVNPKNIIEGGIV